AVFAALAMASTASLLSTTTERSVRPATAARRASLAGPKVIVVRNRSVIPASAITSASPTVWTVTPLAPSSTCLSAQAALRCVLMWGRLASPARSQRSCQRARLESAMPASISTAGVSRVSSVRSRGSSRERTASGSSVMAILPIAQPPLLTEPAVLEIAHILKNHAMLADEDYFQEITDGEGRNEHLDTFRLDVRPQVPDPVGDVRIVADGGGHGAVLAVAQELDMLGMISRVGDPDPAGLDPI